MRISLFIILFLRSLYPKFIIPYVSYFSSFYLEVADIHKSYQWVDKAGLKDYVNYPQKMY